MSLWEYKIITSGKGGFARPDLLEKFLNDLGRDQWEIIEFQSAPDNFLVFTGLARRPTQRDWTLEDAAAAAAKAEAEKLRAEFEAKFKAATAPAPAEERASDFLEEKLAPDDGFRKPVDTSHDADPDVEEEEEKDEWDQLTAREEDELPTFFEAIKPHMRRNQRGPGMSVGVDYLAKKWDQSEDDLRNALLECGFVLPEDEDAKAEYVEYDGDLYWLNINRRGELWINTKEKPRPVFRPIKAQRVVIEDERKSEDKARKSEEGAQKSEPEAPLPESAERRSEAGEPVPEKAEDADASSEQISGRPLRAQGAPAELPQGQALLRKIRPHMRRNRRGPGGSGSASFLSRALKFSEEDLKAAFVALGFKIPTSSSEKPVYLEFGKEVWWLNADSRGGLWINGREKRPGEVIGAPAAGEPADEMPGADTLATAETAAAGDVPGAAAQEPAAPASGEPRASDAGEPVAANQRAPAAEGATPLREAAPTESAKPELQPLRRDGASPITETAAPVAPVLTDVAPAPAVESAPVAPAGSAAAPGATASGVMAAVRPLLKETKSGALSARLDRVAEELGRPVDDLVSALVGAGLKVPDKPREKPVVVEHAGEVLWLNRTAKGELWLNAKAAKFSDQKVEDEDADAEPAAGDEERDPEKKARRSRTRKKPEAEEA